MTIKRDNLSITMTNEGPVLEIEHNHNHEELYNLETITISRVGKALFSFVPYSKMNVNNSCKKWELLPKNGYGMKRTGVDYLPFDLEGGLQIWDRYQSTLEEVTKAKKEAQA